MADDLVMVEIVGSTACVTLNRPEVHNAFDERLIAALTEAFVTLSANEAIRAIVLAGAGKSFCAGADLAWMGRMADYSREENLADARTLQRLLAAIYECPKVTIARVHGAALGGGAGLVAACDIAISAESATFAFSEVRLGLVPAVIAPYVLQKLTPGAARTLFVTGRRINADEAHRSGLVQEVVPDTEIDAAVERVLTDIRQTGPQAVARTKALLRGIDGMSPEDAAGVTVACIADARVSGEGQEGIRAFLGKRRAEWVADTGPHPPPPSPGAAGEGEKEQRTVLGVGQVREAIQNGEFGRSLLKPSPEIAARARELRQEATTAEVALWEMVRGKRIDGAKFRRQHPIGRFIADFFCDDARLIIELDGGIHEEPDQRERDKVREEILRNSELHVLRFSNEEVLRRPNDVRKAIADFVTAHRLSAPPSPSTSPMPSHTTSPPLPQRRERGVGGEGSAS